MSDDLIAVLKRLSATPGVSGSESAVRTLVMDLLTPWADEVSVDIAGNVTALKRGRLAGTARRKVMLSAHMDEIGLVVTGLEGEFLRFTQIGGIDNHILLGQEVLVHGRCPLPGIVASRPPHVVSPDERTKVIAQDKLFIDVGLPSDELKAQVRVGDTISFNCEPVELMGDWIAGKALDNRVSVAAIYGCLRALAEMRHAWDVYAMATAQEEHGNFLGATTGTFRIQPDVALVIDTTFGYMPGLSEAETFKMGDGPALSIGPNIHPAIYCRLADLADALEIPRQTEPLPGHSGTEAWGVQISRGGIPTGIISLPVRNMHTPVEIVSPKDVARAARLMAHFVAGLDETFVEDLVPRGKGHTNFPEIG
jgi:putative aminopeptidase FrvX